MYIDAATVEGMDSDSDAQMVRAIRAALQPFERGLQRVVARVQPNGMSHICRLRAWSQRGQTVVVESRALSRDEAVATATDRLKRALERAPASRRWDTPAAGELHEGKDVAPFSPHESRADGERTNRVLLVLRDLDGGAPSVQWAGVLVEALRAGLEVCRVLPDLRATATLPSDRAWLDATRQMLSATRETRVWCDQTLPHATLSERVIAGQGDYPREVARIARRRGADWIIVSAHAGCGAAAVALARSAGRPVLVARTSTTRYTLLVATEVEMDNYPALDSAARLAVALQAPVLVFHDVRGLSSVDMFTPQIDALAQPWSRIQQNLQHAVDRRPPELDVVLAYSGDRVQGILQQARREDAEMIIMNLPAEESPRGDGLAAAVADGALRSVLIVPSHAPEGDRAPAADDASSEARDATITRIRRVPLLRSTEPIGSQRRR